MKIDTVALLFIKIRRISAAARTPKTDAILKRKIKKRAIFYQATKWNNTYLIVKRLLELKDALINIAHPCVCLSEAQWNDDKNLECLLRHSFLFTKQFQTAHLTLEHFTKNGKMLFKFTQIGGVVADAIRKSMQT